MIIIGIDPGTNKTGWAIIEKTTKYRLIASGVISNIKFKNYHDKLANIGKLLYDIIEKYQPELAVIEDSYVNNNNKTSLILAETRGAIKMQLLNHNIHIEVITPKKVKQNITGNGNADKAQIQKMIHILTGYSCSEHDENDAIAIALSA